LPNNVVGDACIFLMHTQKPFTGILSLFHKEYRYEPASSFKTRSKHAACVTRTQLSCCCINPSIMGTKAHACNGTFIACRRGYRNEWFSRYRQLECRHDFTTLTSGLSGPAGLAIASSGDIFIASYSQDLIWKISPNGGKPEIFVTGLATPAGISFDNHGNLLIANRRTNQVLAATPDGKMSVAVQGELQTPVGAVQMPDGSYFVANISGGISYAGNDGAARTVSRAFASPGAGIAIADAQSVYVVDYGGTEVKRVDKDGTTHVVAGGFRSPVGLAVSREQNRAIVVDWGTNSAYEMEINA